MTDEFKCLNCRELIAGPIEAKRDKTLGYLYITCPHCRARMEVMEEGDGLRVLRMMVPDEPFM